MNKKSRHQASPQVFTPHHDNRATTKCRRLFRLDFAFVYHQAVYVDANSLEEARGKIQAAHLARQMPGAFAAVSGDVHFSIPTMLGGPGECAVHSVPAHSPETSRLWQARVECTAPDIQLTLATDPEGWPYE